MTARHAAPRLRGPVWWYWLTANLADLCAALARVNGLRSDELTDEDKGVVLWVDGLVQTAAIPPPEPLEGGQACRPLAPARRPQLAAAARTWGVAVLRALPLDAVPHLRRGQYKDATGSFAAIVAAPPALRADESFSITRADMTAGLARHAEDWTP